MPVAATPSSLRTQGPIITGGCCYAKPLTSILQNDRRGVWVPAFAGTTHILSRRPASSTSTRDLLDAGDQFVDGLVDRHLLAHHAVHRLGPDVLVVQNRELPVLGQVERRGAAGELVVHRLAMTVSLPERALLAGGGHREPAAERALDIGPDVLFLQQELDELLALGLVLGDREHQPGLDVRAVLDRRTVRLVREGGGDDGLVIVLLAERALFRRQRRVVGIVEPFRRDRDREIV